MFPEKKPIELLSPAGDFAALMAAIQGGADAVYFGIGRLNMRVSSTKNFTQADLPEIKKIATENNIKVYLTLNAVMYDDDLEEITDLLSQVKETGIDAVIASDFSVIEKAADLGVPVHISTQANVSNIGAVEFFARYGEVIVLARELNIQQVQNICRKVTEKNITGPSGKPVRIEAFIHGALCMSVSGKCYLSLHEKNKSANRGECMQLCRRGYTVTEKDDGYSLDIDNEYIMSPKDLTTILILDKILDAGVKVLKIEGRGRSPEYVKIVTSCYREMIDAWMKGAYSFDRAKELESKLNSVYNRGFWEGYYMGSHTGEWSTRYGSNATRKKVYVGKNINYFPRIGVAEFKIETGTLHVGDDILIIGQTTGVLEDRVKEIRIDDRPVEVAGKGENCSIRVNNMVRRSDKLYKWVDAGVQTP